MSEGSRNNKGPGQELLICIVKDHHLVEEILMGYLELGIRGATVVDARGMGQILSTDIPIFAGFRSLFPGGSSGTYVILSVLDRTQIDEAMALTEDVCGDFSGAGTGFVFTVPVGQVKGLAAEIR